MRGQEPGTNLGKPLLGLRILVGRARHQARQLSRGLRALGATVIEIPFIEIRPPRSYKPLDAALKQIEKYDWLILTSVNGAHSLAERMKRLRLSLDRFKHLRTAAIGPSTRAQIEALGLKVAIVPRSYIAESVVESLRGKVEGKRVLLARAKVARDVIPRELRKMGAKVDVVEAYETVVPRSSKELLRQVMENPKRRPHVVTFTSSSTVRNFVALLGEGGRLRPALRADTPHRSMDNLQFASIGPITSATMRELGLPVHIEAKEYTISGLIDAITDAIHSSRSKR